MVTNILDYMYEGYGYDMDNPLLYIDKENYEKALDDDGYSDNGMKTFASDDLGVFGYADRLPTEDANEYKKEMIQFVSENGANYTDLRPSLCGCCTASNSEQQSDDNGEEPVAPLDPGTVEP